MKALLDTNIIIHREAHRGINPDIGTLFKWLENLGVEKWIHPQTLEELQRHKDRDVRQVMAIKIKNYNLLSTIAPITDEIKKIGRQFDVNENDKVDTLLLAEVYAGRIDYLITEDRKIHQKAKQLKLSEKVFKIDQFIEKAVSENPEIVDYKVLSVKKERFGNILLEDHFFDSFKEDYNGFKKWYNSKSEKIAYISTADNEQILAFLYVKAEGKKENYSDITPRFKKKRRLKIGTFKVVINGMRLGERFMKIIFDNALAYKVDEIYVTLFNKSQEHERLISLLEDWGFCYHGIKESSSGTEKVYTRDFSPSFDPVNPRLSYPFISKNVKKFLVPIWPVYHTELLPDSILNTESPLDFIENQPNRNAIRKVYISRSHDQSMSSGDIVIFYRTSKGLSGKAKFKSVTSTIGIVEETIINIKSQADFMALCHKRSVFEKEDLLENWNRSSKRKPFVLRFLYVHSFPKRMILRDLKASGIIESHPQGIMQITDEAFEKLLKGSNANQSLIVD